MYVDIFLFIGVFQDFFPRLTWKKYLLGLVAKALDGVLEVSEFKIQSRYNLHFRTIIPSKRINLVFLPAVV